MVLNKQKGFIENYFKKVNIRPAKDGKQFLDILSRKYDKSLVEEFTTLMTERPSKTLSVENYKDNIYELKNRNLEFSIDLIRYNGDLYIKYFKWFSGLKKINPKRILDIGCENGFITCFYGLLFPKAEIIGIDPCENAIERAKELSKKLKLGNVTFLKAGIEEVKNLYPLFYFDLITSVMTFKDITGSYIQKVHGTPIQNCYWSLEDLQVSIGSEDSLKYTDILANLLTNDGKFISFERWFPEDTIWWADKLKNSNLYIKWDESQILEFHEVGEPRTFPAMVIDKNFKEYNNIEKAANLWLSKEVFDLKKNTTYLNLAAEIMFRNTLNKRFFQGVQCNYTDNVLKVRYELWISGDKLLCYQYTNSGYRELRIIPMETEEAMNKMIKDLRRYLLQYGYKVFKYDSVDKRES